MMPQDSNFFLHWDLPLYCILPDDAGEEHQDDGEEADPDGAHIER